MRSLFSTAIVLALLSPLSSHAAGGKPLPAEQHDPPVFLDESQAVVTLVTHGSEGYVFRAYVRVSGFSSKTDTLHLDWKQGGKVLGTAKCDVSYDIARKRAWGDCKYDDKALKAKGAIEADLIYWDDQQSKEYLVRTFKVNVKTWQELGNTTLYQVVPDDLLGLAWARHGYSNAQATELRPEFVFWATPGNFERKGSLRCTVDGKKLPDFDAFFDSVTSAEQIEADHTPKDGGPHQVYRWEHVSLRAENTYGGPKDVAQKTIGGGEGPRYLIDNPGKWDCEARSAGKAVRRLLFTVNSKGWIDQDEMQSGKHAIPTLPNIVLIDMRIPADTGFDQRIRSDAMKKSAGFGLPWPEQPKVQQVQSAFPASSGLPDP